MKLVRLASWTAAAAVALSILPADTEGSLSARGNFGAPRGNVAGA